MRKFRTTKMLLSARILSLAFSERWQQAAAVEVTSPKVPPPKVSVHPAKPKVYSTGPINWGDRTIDNNAAGKVKHKPTPQGFFDNGGNQPYINRTYSGGSPSAPQLTGTGTIFVNKLKEPVEIKEPLKK